LLTVEPRGVAMMDMIEGHPHFFHRGRVRVDTADGPVEAWIYWGPEDLAAQCPLIPSGDWFER
ncbi:MAG: gamma-glutamylcyclotransferase, partial [Anaerolineae bacterium]|nr:gamma-glutamylcyclotransferase [Anaerolineae bacterium]